MHILIVAWHFISVILFKIIKNFLRTPSQFGNLASTCYQLLERSFFMHKTNLNQAAIKKIDGIDCIDIDHLPMKYVNHKFKSRNVNWSNLLMLVDISRQSKKYATLVIEKNMNCYQLYDSTTTIINHQLEKECFLNDKLCNSICNELSISNKRPIIHSQASLLPLQSRNNSRYHSWINTNLVDYTVSGRQSNSVFLYTPDENIHIKINERPSYLKKKFNDIQKIQLFIIDIRNHFDLISAEIGKSISNNPNTTPACRYGFTEQHYRRFIYSFAEEIYLSSSQNKKD